MIEHGIALEKCPFCGGEATLRTIVNQHFVECRKCWAHSAHASGIINTAEQAIAAWNRRATQPNEPLTLEQLKQMDGEPVYCVDTAGNGKWALVHTADEICTDSDFGDWEFYSYGWTD